jgi:hypothetical protein
LREKVEIYDELVESLKELVNRNSRYMRNEIELCRLINETAVVKRELEQKEKYVDDIAKDIDHRSAHDQDLNSRIKARIQGK